MEVFCDPESYQIGSHPGVEVPYIRLCGVPELPAYPLHPIFLEDPLSQEQVIYFYRCNTFFWCSESLLMTKKQTGRQDDDA